MHTLRDNVTVALILFWIGSVVFALIISFLNLDEKSSLPSYAMFIFFSSSAAGVTYAYIKDHPGPPTEWLVKGIAVIAIISAIAFLFQGSNISSDDDYGYSGYEHEYKPPTFESRSVAAATLFGRCVVGLLFGVLARAITLKEESRQLQDENI